MKSRAALVSIAMVFFVLSGSLAYSSFQGQIITKVSATADFIGVGEEISVCSFWANNTYLYVNGNELKGNSGCLFNDLDPPLVVVPKAYSYTGEMTNSLYISNLGPGNAILFCFKIYNPNNQECFLSNISLGSFNGSGLTELAQSSCDNQSVWFQIVNTTLENEKQPGGFYGFVIEGQDYIPAGGVIYVAFFLLLSCCSGNSYQESSFHLPIQINLSAA
ncbi:MAG TPA: hypothetical protein VKU79_04810 [Thermoplasmataceae archaeon]|nr:hypothetical protein [Thermoplasmataceae archaeon]